MFTETQTQSERQVTKEDTLLLRERERVKKCCLESVCGKEREILLIRSNEKRGCFKAVNLRSLLTGFHISPSVAIIFSFVTNTTRQVVCCKT